MNPIPAFDHNLVLPPHVGDPTQPEDLSPYPCTSEDLCDRFATSTERVAILTRFLDFRERLQSEGLVKGFQWLDGSFMEDVETRENRPPGDIDVVTVFWGYDLAFQQTLVASFPEFLDNKASKSAFHVDHFPFDADHNPEATVEITRYWMQLFTHNRQAVWKGMLKIDLNTPQEDTAARDILSQFSP